MTANSASMTAQLFDDGNDAPIDPFALFSLWLEDARQSEINDANAMALASVDADGMPDLRMVLLNGFSPEGFVFFTNYGSAKGQELLANPKAALLFHWKSVRRQFRVRGPVETVSGADADAYFATRPLQSQVGAHASDQSRPLDSRQTLIERVETLTGQMGDNVERPVHWSGFRVKPLQIEFWQDGAFRLHDRVQFRRDTLDQPWSRTRLYP